MSKTHRLTLEEEILLHRLSKPPKCMHDPKEVIDLGNSWQCPQCGLVAKKIVKIIGYE